MYWRQELTIKRATVFTRTRGHAYASELVEQVASMNHSRYMDEE